MKIINGKWYDTQENLPVLPFNFHKFKEIADKVSTVYGEKDITHDRIEIIARISKLNQKQSHNLAGILLNKNVSKIIGT